MLIGLTSSTYTVDVQPTLNFDPDFFTNFDNNLTSMLKSQANSFMNIIGEMEDVYVKRLGSQIGGGRAYLQNFRETFALARGEVMSMGGQFEDIADIQVAVNKGVGAITNITAEGISDLYAASSVVAEGMEVTAENTKVILENFTKAGISLYNIGSKVNEIFNLAKESGANAKMVYEEIEKNLSKLNLFNFKNGIEGMTKMAIQAQNLRISMDDALQIAENLYDPEKAVEMASVFQRFGMGSLTNVYELQDMARSDPGKLMDMMSKEFSRFVEIDAVTGQKTITAMGQEVIRVLSKEVPGLKTDLIVQSGLAMAELQDKIKNITMPVWATDDNLQQLILKQAQMGKEGTEFEGQYVINIGGVTKAVSSLGEDDSEILRKQLTTQITPEKDIVDKQLSTQQESVRLTNAITALNEFYPNLIASNKTVNESLDKLSKTMSDVIRPTLYSETLFNIKTKKTEEGSERLDFTEAFTKFQDKATSIITTFENSFVTLMQNLAVDPSHAIQFGRDFVGAITDSIINAIPSEFKDVEKIRKDLLTPLTNVINNILTTPSTSTATPSALPASSNAISSSVPTGVTPLTPSSSVINLVQTNPITINHNMNFPDLNARLQNALTTDPIFMNQLVDHIGNEMKRQGLWGR
jgi:hypothetical protein